MENPEMGPGEPEEEIPFSLEEDIIEKPEKKRDFVQENLAEELKEARQDLAKKLETSEEEQGEIPLTETQRTTYKKSKPSFFDRLRRWAAPMILIGGSAAGVGCEKPSTEPAQPPRIENEDSFSEGYKINKSFLKGEFERISGGALGKSEQGNLIVHVGGGHYYELENSDLEELMTVAENYRLKMEGTKNKRVLQSFQEVADMTIKDKIIKMGHQLSESDLPINLKEFEEGRKRIIEDMEEGSIAQPTDENMEIK